MMLEIIDKWESDIKIYKEQNNTKKQLSTIQCFMSTLVVV